MADFLSKTEVKKTRKTHRCEWCPEIIEDGAAATKLVWAEDGAAESSYWHPECYAVAGSYSDYDPHWESFETQSQKRGAKFEEFN